MCNVKTSQGSQELICVLRPFLTLSSEMSGGSREGRVDECFSYITIIRSASKVTVFLFIFCVLIPDLSDSLASFTFFPCPFTFFLAHWCDTHSVMLSLPLSHSNKHTHCVQTYCVSPRGACSLYWLLHISFHLNLIWKQNYHILSNNFSAVDESPLTFIMQYRSVLHFQISSEGL